MKRDLIRRLCVLGSIGFFSLTGGVVEGRNEPEQFEINIANLSPRINAGEIRSNGYSLGVVWDNYILPKGVKPNAPIYRILQEHDFLLNKAGYKLIETNNGKRIWKQFEDLPFNNEDNKKYKEKSFILDGFFR